MRKGKGPGLATRLTEELSARRGLMLLPPQTRSRHADHFGLDDPNSSRHTDGEEEGPAKEQAQRRQS